MFKSEKLVRITIQVPEEFISPATGVLSKFKLLHLISIDETHLGHLGYRAETDDGLLKEYDELLAGEEKLLQILHVGQGGTVAAGSVIPEKDVFKLKERLGEIRREIDTALGDLVKTERTLGEKTALLERFKLLRGDIDFSRLINRHFVNWIIGLVPAEGLDRLNESLSRVHHALIEVGSVKERSVVLVFGLKKDWQVFERALKGALLEPIEIPPGTTGTVDEILASLESEIGDLQGTRQNLAAQREVLQGRFGGELHAIKERTLAARRILSARRLFGKIDKSYLISGWIPERLCDLLGEELNRVTDGRVVFEKVNPEELREARKGIARIPILFNNPMLIRPFEKLTDLYGTPRYKEVEPTVFFALSFLLLFGMMFGDVGQGLVLFISGYLIFRRFYGHMDYGIILMECGASSALFGFLYGSVFGLEHVIPALWFRPMDNIPYFVKVALSLGVGLISLGLVLNIVNAIRLKEIENILSGGGIAGALLYWMAAGLAVKYFVTGKVAPSELTLLGWATAFLITIMILHRPLYRLLIKRERPGQVLRHAGLLTELMESIVEVFDDLLRFVANTVSFIRVAAFALSHTALFIAVFSIANVVSHEETGKVSYWLVVAVGNVIIIFLEGLVVSIQTVRLEYYEFFGKFFRGGGEKFKPFDREIGPEDKKT